VVGPATSTAQPVNLMWAAKVTTRRGGTKIESRVSRRESYLHRSRKKGGTQCRKIPQGKTLLGATASTSWRALWLTAHSAGVGR
jgi:hypothetical protein